MNDRIVKRLYAKGIFSLQSAAHFGCGVENENGPVDMSLLRNEDGRPYILGSSIAGAARSHLARKLHAWEQYSSGDWSKLKLFGYDIPLGKSAKQQRTMSPLIVSDAYVLDDAAETTVRDGVAIKADAGVAEEGKKYDYEIVESGASFQLEFECTLREQDMDETGGSVIEDQFYSMLHSFRKGEITLGARTSRGLGCGNVADWNIRELRMNAPDHVLAWLYRDPWSNAGAGKSLPRDVSEDNHSFFRIHATFRLDSSMLIREPNPPDKDCDYAHLRSSGKPVVPGTSAAGAWRKQVELIARTLWNEDSDGRANDVVAEMFGPLHAGNDRERIWRSRVRIEERFVEVKSDALVLKERVAIDRFTGSGLDSAKFNECPLEPKKDEGDLEFELTLDDPEDCEIGLLLLALKDFWMGRANIGGESSLGRGLLKGENATIEWKPKLQAWKFRCDENAPFKCIEGDVRALENFVEKPQTPPDRGYCKASRKPKIFSKLYSREENGAENLAQISEFQERQNNG